MYLSGLKHFMAHLTRVLTLLNLRYVHIIELFSPSFTKEGYLYDMYSDQAVFLCLGLKIWFF